MELYIAEKPSVGRTIASVIGANERRDGYWEGNGRMVSWCIGHLVALAMPEAYRSDYQRWRYSDLPILPEKWQYTVVAETKKQFELLRRLMHDSRVTSLVCATDAGREGELIFRLVYAMADCRKEVRRLWISSTEESAIRQALCRMKPMHDYDNLYRAALCRAQADWLIGINATRLYSLLYGRPLPTGRVMSPALAMLVQREAAIADFQSTPFFAVKLETDPLAAKSERMDSLTEARALLECCNHAPYAVVQKIARRQRSENPPLLYDLTTLQQDANRLFGFTAQQTLDYAQSLYEKQLLTYPRTDSRYLTQDMQEKLPELAARVCRALPFASALELHLHPERVVDDSKVSDHPAIIPTAAMPAQAQRLQQIEQGAEKPEDFMRDIQAFVKELMVNPQRAEHAETLFPPLREKIGSCPKCGAAITEHPQGYLCENRICGFALWKKGGILAHAETPLTAAEAKTLLTKGAVRKTGLHSTRTNARYDAVLHLDFGKDGRAILRPRFD